MGVISSILGTIVDEIFSSNINSNEKYAKDKRLTDEQRAKAKQNVADLKNCQKQVNQWGEDIGEIFENRKENKNS